MEVLLNSQSLQEILQIPSDQLGISHLWVLTLLLCEEEALRRSPLTLQPSGFGAVFPQGAGARRKSQLESPPAPGRSWLHCGGARAVPAGPGAHRGSPVPQPFRSVLVCAFLQLETLKYSFLGHDFSTFMAEMYCYKLRHALFAAIQSISWRIRNSQSQVLALVCLSELRDFPVTLNEIELSPRLRRQKGYCAVCGITAWPLCHLQELWLRQEQRDGFPLQAGLSTSTSMGVIEAEFPEMTANVYWCVSQERSSWIIVKIRSSKLELCLFQGK